jgi:arabinan endo-1,5-alpha-L-arabinosidase
LAEPDVTVEVQAKPGSDWNACPTRTLAALPVVLLLGQLPPLASTDGILAGGADPSIVAVQEADGRYGYYVVSTGRGISISYSRDLKDWRRIGRVFAEEVPRWARDKVPKANGIWAPDLSFHKGLYYLYYSVSSFGSQRSVIGLTVNKTLDRTSPDYRWLDRGKVIGFFRSARCHGRLTAGRKWASRYSSPSRDPPGPC